MENLHVVDLRYSNANTKIANTKKALAAIEDAQENKIVAASHRRKKKTHALVRLKPVAAALVLLLLLARPEAAVAGGQRAMRIWCASVAPSLFPFLALMPMLVSDAARAFYRRTFGRLMAFFGLPASAAPALLIGLVAGSPAGALAVRRTALAELRIKNQRENQTGDPAAMYRAGDQNARTQGFQRLALAVCGMSPAYLVIGVGQGLLGSTRLGWRLALAQLCTQLLLLLLLRRFESDQAPRPSLLPDPAHKTSQHGAPTRGASEGRCADNGDSDNQYPENQNPENQYPENRYSEVGGLKHAVESVLSICGYMVLFGSVGAAAASLLGDRLGLALLALCDVTGGLAGLARRQAGLRFVAVGATVGFGGLCIAAQNVDVLRPLGVDLKTYLRVRILAALLCAGLFGMFSASFPPTSAASVQNKQPQSIRVCTTSKIGGSQNAVGVSKQLGSNTVISAAPASPKQEYYLTDTSAAQKEVSTASIVRRSEYPIHLTTQEKASPKVSIEHVYRHVDRYESQEKASHASLMPREYSTHSQEKPSHTVPAVQDHMLKPVETYAFSLLFAAIFALPALFLSRKS